MTRFCHCEKCQQLVDEGRWNCGAPDDPLHHGPGIGPQEGCDCPQCRWIRGDEELKWRLP